ncbi:hypothetical protein [Bradyrhizobium sp. USDA 313]|uniref:hypothetical protein n=1 Tax=Bradyrhizobium sp. USDA 313 TaxID=3156307 RepID=UPI00351807B0
MEVIRNVSNRASAKRRPKVRHLIATRHYSDIDPATGARFDLKDRMYRVSRDSFVLAVAGELPSDPEVEVAYSLEEVFAWYQDCPQQIERAVIVNANHWPDDLKRLMDLVVTCHVWGRQLNAEQMREKLASALDEGRRHYLVAVRKGENGRLEIEFDPELGDVGRAFAEASKDAPNNWAS